MRQRLQGREIAILTYHEILVWARAPAQSWSQAVEGTPCAVAAPDPGKDQMLSYSHDGTLFLVAGERGATNSELIIVAAGTVRRNGDAGPSARGDRACFQ